MKSSMSHKGEEQGTAEVSRIMRVCRKNQTGFLDRYDPLLLVTAGLTVFFVLFMSVIVMSNRELFRALP